MKKINKVIKYAYLYLKDIRYSYKNKVKIYNTEETLNEIIYQKKSISRFGDGEINFILGFGSPSQKYNEKLALLLKKILAIKEKENNHIVGIPFVWSTYKGYTMKSIKFWLIYLINNRKKIYSLLNLNCYYYDSQITRIYINRKDKNTSKKYFTLWKKVWTNKDVLIIEGKYSRFGVGNDLLSSARSVDRILCPAKNAFDKYDEIKNEVLKISKKYDVVLILLGPTATVLAYELSKTGIFAIDLGNLDIEYEWLNKGVKKQEKIKGKYSYEVFGGEEVEEVRDVNYKKQIIKVIEDKRCIDE